jgi:hypothetical protein
LALSEEGTKEALITLIKSNLEAHPELWQNPQFAGLFSSRGQQRSTPTNENIAPQLRGPVTSLSSYPSTSNQAAARPSQLHPSAATHTFRPTQSFGTYHYSLYTNYTPETTHNIPTPPLQPHLCSPLISINNPTIYPDYFYHPNPSDNYHST